MSNTPRPLFIVGAARSGTSYLHALLNIHPHIRLSYESRLFTEGYHHYRREPCIASAAGFNRFLDRILALEEDEDKNRWLCHTIRAHSAALYRRHLAHGTFTGVVEDIFRLAGRPLACFGNKMLRAELCPDIATLWPHALFIVLIRDPRAVAASQIRRFKGRRLAYAAIYNNTHLTWARQLARHCDRYLPVSYEAFVNDPALHLDRILAFAGLDEDVKFHRKRMLRRIPPRKDSQDKWRTTLTAGQVARIESYCFDNMAAWGYRPETAGRQKYLSWIEKCIELGYEKREALFYSPETWRRKKILSRLFNIIRRESNTKE